MAIIPARGGSKGVHKKNVRIVDGKPLIAYSIECALNSKSVTHCLVNTDDDSIALVSKQWGADVMMRLPGQGEDTSPILPVLISTLEYAQLQTQKQFDIIILLQPTSPIRTSTDIDNVIKMLLSPVAPDGIISVVPMSDTHPARMYHLDGNGFMHTIWPNGETLNRQELAPVYLRNGCIYAVKTAAMLKEQTLMVKHKQAYVMEEKWLANIDTERDLIITELLIKKWKEQTV
ncbi:MAG: acylneuraminate cytidylyltransferase family protein [Chitinophagaceae bacterium]